MYLFTLPLLLTLSVLFTNLYHPLAMGLLLLVQTTLISITIGLSTYSFWFSYILFLVFLGGMLILFMYVTSLASNEPFIFKMMTLVLLVVVFFLSLLTTVTFDSILSIMTTSSLPLSSLEFTQSTRLIVSWIYNYPSMAFTLYIVSYLLLTLIVVVKIVNLFKGPLRLMN
uniref:NADH dehydrogenase subunit 6 n=1 Tax=Opecarcinus hypostegus TaxID=1903098 RepID=UPI0028D03A2C|nr:NADH dehydrogenase subunit 6 [Opecarcinus hypostegus]WMY25246.1 NADH dehydrogenase subunit 6 [Opecarcinus hypostegus]